MNDDEAGDSIHSSTTDTKHQLPVGIKDDVTVGTATLTAKALVPKIIFRLINIISIIFNICTAVALIVNFAQYFSHSLQPVAPMICVFLPNYKFATGGAFYQDGVVQQAGFDKAVFDSKSLVNCLKVDFQYMELHDTPDVLINRMKKLYTEAGATYFVMTMSSKVCDLRERFMKWHDECVYNGKKEPILIATVVSAPEIADAYRGILRWYIRSEEESDVLAKYMRWKLNVLHAGIFYITQTPGLSDDNYGYRGMQVFRTRFNSLGGQSVDMYSTTAGTAKQNVTLFLSKIKTNWVKDMNSVGVFVIGYGEMVRDVLNELISQGFAGPIVCTSTLTEPEWQPQKTNADSHIFTVLPRLLEPQDELQKNDRNVVFFFAKETLFHVLKLTASDPNPQTFVARWRGKTDMNKLDQESLANGDILVHLNIANYEMWR